MAYAGLRPEEALALQWRDVGAVIHVHRAYTWGELKGTKTLHRRTVEVMRPLAEDLAAWREVARAEPEDLVCPALGRGDREPDPGAAARFVHLGNWRNRVLYPAAIDAGLYITAREKGGKTVMRSTVTPSNGRDTFASLLIHEGRNPGRVAADLGHGDPQTMWRHYVHVFETAALAPNVPMAEAIEAARIQVGATSDLYPSCTRGGGEVVSEPAGEDENPLG
jgi:integrase